VIFRPKYGFFILFLCYQLILLTIPLNAKSQDLKQVFEKRNEVYFRVPANQFREVQQFSFDKIKDGYIYAYASKYDYMQLLQIEQDIELLTPPSEINPAKMAKSLKELKEWDSYPTYDQYIEMMYQLEADHPDICRIHNIGESVEGRKILFAKISDNVDEEESEPDFMYSSSMHGDELVGYVMMLRLIDYLLNQYDSIDQIRMLVDSVEIWINPLANPDGAYANGDTTVYSSTRMNANYVDLNRNFPDPEDGLNPDNKERQQENIVMMDFVESHTFVHSANIHGGSTVLNYPWDTWSQLHADDDWYQLICRQYVDTVHNYAPDYMTDYNNGITNGYQWYSISGGRQDYMNFYRKCREVTFEVGATKVPTASSLPEYWDNNYRSLINYIENVIFGIRGYITDAETGMPLYAKINVISHDLDGSDIYSDTVYGNYHRLIKAGTYDIIFSANGYESNTIHSVIVEDFTPTYLNVALEKASFKHDLTSITIESLMDDNLIIFDINLENAASAMIELFDISGREIASLDPGYLESGAHTLTYNISNLKRGYYIYRFQTGNYTSHGWIRKSL